MEEISTLANEVYELERLREKRHDDLQSILKNYQDKTDEINVQLYKKKAELTVYQEEERQKQINIKNAFEIGGVKPDDPYPENVEPTKINWKGSEVMDLLRERQEEENVDNLSEEYNELNVSD